MLVGGKAACMQRGTRAARESAPAAGGTKRAYHYRSGTVALCGIRRCQNLTELLFQRLVREMARFHNSSFPEPAVMVLQGASEAYLIGLFDDTNLCAVNAKGHPVGLSHLW